MLKDFNDLTCTGNYKITTNFITRTYVVVGYSVDALFITSHVRKNLR